MNHFKRSKIYKMLMLTTSENDAEALMALRMANKFIKAENLSWHKLLNMDNYSPKLAQFDFIIESQYTTPKGKELALSLHHYYMRKSKLTEKQEDLFKSLLKQAGWSENT
jgi:membrane-associated HD superfamily phosphohydrolase